MRHTCESFLAAGVDEIIVVDDGSTDGSCEPGGLPAGVVVVRNETPLGVGRARNQGAAAATGDVFIFADAHERADMSLRPFAQAALELGAVLCAAVKPLRGGGGSHGPGGKREWTGYGARLIEDQQGVAYKNGWNMRRPKERFGKIDTLIGACYAISRATFDHIGGWVATHQWGYNEQALSMKAWLCDVPIVVDAETIVRHQFKHRFKYPASKSGSQVNRWHVHAVLFDADTFEGYWAPRFRMGFGEQVERDARKLLATSAVQDEIEAFRKCKVRTDKEFFEQLAPSLPVLAAPSP